MTDTPRNISSMHLHQHHGLPRNTIILILTTVISSSQYIVSLWTQTSVLCLTMLVGNDNYLHITHLQTNHTQQPYH